MDRIFLDWKHDFLRAAARWSIQRGRQSDAVDLAGEEHLFSGRRAARRYLEILLEECEAEGLALDPPELLVPRAYCASHLDSQLLPSTDLELEFAWRSALREADQPTREALSLAVEDSGWLSRQLAELHRELLARGASLEPLSRELPLPESERLRLAAIGHLQADVEDRLRRAGKAPLEALPLRASGSKLVLVGVLELPHALSEQLRAHDTACALVHAPPGEADRFDEYGRPIAEAFADSELELDLRVCADPAQLAAAVVARLAELGNCPRDEISLGILDPAVEAPLRAELATEELRMHRAEGVPVKRQALRIALARLRDFARDRSARSLAEFFRSTLVEARLRELVSQPPLEELDRYAHRVLLYRLAEPWPPPDCPHALRPALSWTADLLAELTAAARPLPEWCEAIRRCAAQLCGEEALDVSHPAGRRSLELLQSLRDLLDEIAGWPAHFGGPIEGPAALDLVLAQLDRLHLSEIPDEDSLEALGWLELANDDASHVLLLGANEGTLPASPLHDSLLADALRAEIGLMHDREREARDLYLLHRLVHGRRSCTLFVSRRDLAAKPLLPSRLLFRCAAGQLPQRLEQLLNEPTRSASWAEAIAASEFDHPSIGTPPTLPPLPIVRLRVSDFASWLNCPYRHQLRRLLGRNTIDYDARELDAAQAGTLIHRLAERLIREAPELREADAIERWLLSAFDESMRRNFGAWSHPATRVQAELIAGRLRALARVQAEWRQEGWEPLEVELDLRYRVEIDGEPLEIVGRIDRVDRHRDGSLGVLDLKTSNKATSPRRSHGPNRSGEWSDFQLPLYRRMLRAERPELAELPTRLGYLNLPADSADSGVELGQWSEEELEANWRAVEAIVRAMRRGEGLDAPSEPPPPYSDDLSLICRDQVFQNLESDEVVDL